MTNRKVLLLLDICSARPCDLSEGYTNIKWPFLPANTTSELHPLYEGIQPTRVHYRKMIVQLLLFRLVKVDKTKLTDGDLLKAFNYRIFLQLGT